ncbi:MAG: transglycosylase domain-containing protein [Maricaulaceae bacterium]
MLDTMVRAGKITPLQREKAVIDPIVIKRAQATAGAAWFVDWADAQTRRLIGAPPDDVWVETTLDLSHQRAAEAALRAHPPPDGAEAAFVALDGSGGVLAMVGGRSYAQSQFNRAVQAQRQPGSAFKPFVYLAALRAGLGPDTQVLDAPIRLGDWSPTNYKNDYRGPVSLEDALAGSINTVAVRLAETVGRRSVIDAARSMGYRGDLEPTRAMALGAHATSLLDLTAAYTPFANGGAVATPFAITRIRTFDDQLLYERAPDTLALGLDAREHRIMADMLQTVVAEGTGRRARQTQTRVGGKTGTTNDFRDAWFVGVAGDLAAGVWLGRDDFSPMAGVTGGTRPAEIWGAYAAALYDGAPPPLRPWRGGAAPRLEPVETPVAVDLSPLNSPKADPANDPLSALIAELSEQFDAETP